MYLKKYDLSERLLSNAKALLLCYNIMENDYISLEDVKNCQISRKHGGINFFSRNGWNLEISDTGLMYGGMEESHWLNSPYNDHLLLETQWIDPVKQMPNEGQKVIVKAENDEGIMILTSEFIVERNQRESGFVDFYFVANNNCGEIMSELYVDTIGWLPAENAVL